MKSMAEDEPYVEKPRRYSITKALVPFNKGKEAVESVEGGKFRVPATWLNQQVREERGYQDDVSRYGNWVLEGVLYRQKADNVFTRTGLPYLHPDEAVSAHSQRREYTLEACTQDEIDKAVAEGLIIDPGDLKINAILVIPCSDFGSNKYSLFFFGGKGTEKERSDRAKASGLWLIDSPKKIKEFTIFLNDKNYSQSIGEDYANQMWFRSLGDRSGLDGDRYWGRGLHYYHGVLGVLNESAEGAAQKSA